MKMNIKKYYTNRWLMFALSLVFFAITMFAFSSGYLNQYHMQILSLMCINVILAVSLNLINGFTGQFSIGHAGFMASGAYVSALLTNTLKISFDFSSSPFLGAVILIAAIVCGGLFSGLVGFLIGLPTLRLRGDYLAIATLGFGEIIRVVIINLDFIGGPRGYGGMPKLTSFGLAFFVAILSVYIIVNFINSTHGRACISIREDEIASETMGINTTKYKIMAFSIGAFFAGVAGALFAHMLTYLHPSMFGFLRSIDILVMVVLGGLGSITGSISAAIFITYLNELLRQFIELRMIIYSLMLIIVMLTRPQGLLGNRELSVTGLLSSRNWAKRKGGVDHD
jgi:branched-chain amino acid transport system permease protein